MSQIEIDANPTADITRKYDSRLLSIFRLACRGLGNDFELWSFLLTLFHLSTTASFTAVVASYHYSRHITATSQINATPQILAAPYFIITFYSEIFLLKQLLTSGGNPFDVLHITPDAEPLL